MQDLGTFQNFSHFCHILVTFATLLHFLPHLGTFCHIFAIFGSFPQFLTTIGIFWQLLSCFCNFWTFWHILATRATFDIFCNFKHLWADFGIFLVTFGYFQLSIFWPLSGNFRQLGILATCGLWCYHITMLSSHLTILPSIQIFILSFCHPFILSSFYPSACKFVSLSIYQLCGDSYRQFFQG